MSAYADVMIVTARELGTALRARRRELGLTQDELARRAGVTRQWMIRLERGHGTAELGLVLAVVRELGLAVDLQPTTEQVNGDIDLDELLERYS